LLGSYLYLARHLFFPHLLPPSTLHFPLPPSLSTIPRSRWCVITLHSDLKRWTVPRCRSVARRMIGSSQGRATSYVLVASRWGAFALIMPSLGLRPARRDRGWSRRRSRQQTLRGGRMSSSVSWVTRTAMALVSFSSLLSSSFFVYSSVLFSNRE
jgi:hypothetical protein